jgi:hypothetical protein
VTSPTGKFDTISGTGVGTDLAVSPGGKLTLSPTGALVFAAGSGNITLSAAGNLMTAGSLTATTNIQGVQLVSTATTGTPPLVVASTTLVPNLHVANADNAINATSAGTATTAATATNALNLNGQPSTFYLDTSATAQAKAGLLTLTGGFTSSAASAVNANLNVGGILHVTTAAGSIVDNALQVGSLHDVGALVVDGNAQVTGTLAVTGNAQFNANLAVTGSTALTGNLTVTGSTTLNGDVAGGSKFRGLTTGCTLLATVETCPYQGSVTLGAAPKSILLTAAGDYSPATRYWIPLAPTTTGFSVQFNTNPLVGATATPIQFYYVVIQ